MKLKVKLKNKKSGVYKRKGNENKLNSSIFNNSKKKVYKKKKKIFNNHKIDKANIFAHSKNLKSKNGINRKLSIENPKNDLFIKNISKNENSFKNNSKIENESKQIKSIDINKRKDTIIKKLIKNKEYTKSDKIKKKGNYNKISNMNSLHKDNINKNICYHKNKKIRNEFKDVYMDKNKQKYKKKKKIESSPEEIVNSSLFRYINEYMYINKSEVVEKKLNETKNIFNIYHLGYKNQKNKWPKNPVNVIINYLKKNFTKLDKIGDLGCGEAEIAKTLNGWSIDSFDLIKFNEYVTVCNITKLEKPDNSYDCLILSLSLMNIDWPKIIFESVRCLKEKGTLMIAEVVSRFKNYKAFIKFMNNMGLKLLNKVNLDDFFYVFFFENNKKDILFPLNEKRTKKISELLDPCIYKRR